MKTYLKRTALLAFVATAIFATAQDGNQESSEDLVPTGKGWRMIEGSESPGDPALALAWSVDSDAEDAIQRYETGHAYTDLDERTNHIVNLASGEILGKTEGQHGSDSDHERGRSTYHEVFWSESGDYLVQLETGERAHPLAAWIYHVNEDRTKASPGSELLETARKAVGEQLDGSDLLKKTPWDEFEIRLHDVHVDRRGSGSVLLIGVEGEGGDDASFDSTVTLKLLPSKESAAPELVLQSVEIHE